MLHNHKKEIMYSAISVCIAVVLSIKAYDVKCMYLEDKDFRQMSLSTKYAYFIEFWSIGMIPAFIWMYAEI